ncbi:EAL domain-containing protein [uncultured Oxalicibacterium sp.]|uniref:putative bifunctional diguanylate cyclase/phosphodiesterase n=1 Tax=uncultured Oxalicibacterium sp. TaxID=1168540 RepID=UPI0025DE7C93|nr:EAL domain-containing protein [uncultured Oxalicibacterium sp.]
MNHVSLATRIVAVMLLILLVVQATSYWAVRVAIERQVRNQIQSDLMVAERVWLQLLTENARRLREASIVLAADYGFREAVTTEDKTTIASALENGGDRIGATLAILLDPEFSVVTGNRTVDTQSTAALRRISLSLSHSEDMGMIAALHGNLYQFVMVPVHAPHIVGWVLMGFPVAQPLLDALHRLSGSHAFLLSPASDADRYQDIGTLPDPDRTLRQALQLGAPEIDTDEGMLVTHYVRLGDDSDAETPRLVLLKSIAEASAPFFKLQWMLGLITLLGVVLFAFGSQRAASWVTRPIKELTSLAQALEKGRFNVSVAGTTRGDEVGSLARAFDSMRSSIATQQEEIRRLAYWDRLTGLPNREQFRLALEQAILANLASATPLVVLTLNLDRFKHVNDVMGYDFGDELLRAVANRLQQQIHSAQDMVARVGGDEFALLLTNADALVATEVARNIGMAFETPLALNGQTVDLHARMGGACWPQDAAEAELLRSRSEIALRAAKNKIVDVLFYTPSLDSTSAQTLSLLGNLRHALLNNELRLFLQPKIDTMTGEVVAAEALIRWEHPQRGMVPPMEFIPFAEQTGFVRELTIWMFETAAELWHDLQPATGSFRIAINLSTRDLMDINLPERLLAIMQSKNVTADAFSLEITESAIMDDVQRAEATLERLAKQGFKLSIDDFGTGFSSLAYLKRLPVHELKIDKSFVMGMETDASDAKIVRSTIDLAHNLGLSVVAEGVESRSLLDRLAELRCDEAQGYFISRPIPAAQFNTWRENWATTYRTFANTHSA